MSATKALMLLAVICFGVSGLWAQTQALPPTVLNDGKQVFLDRCAGCHGSDAYGTDHAPALAGNRHVRARTRDQIRSLVQHGIASAGMPAFDLPEPQLNAVAVFVHSLNSAAAENPVTGDITVGRELFAAKGACASCHMVNGNGSPIGPDLSDVGRQMTIEEIEGVLLHPDAHITPGYEMVRVTLRSGQTLKGFSRARSNFDLELQDLEGRFHLLQAKNIQAVENQKQSLMRPWSGTRTQLADLVAYLSHLTGVTAESVKPSSNQEGAGQAAGIEFSRIENPHPGDWATYNGKLQANRFSNLTQINKNNVRELAVKWVFPIAHFGLEATPIVVDGIMYMTGPNLAYALDASTGRAIWQYSRPRTQGLVGDASLGTNRGLAIFEDKVFMVTDNAHLIALNRITGSLVWEVVMPEEPEKYGSTVSPLIVNDTVIAGVSGGDWGIRGFVICYDATTGRQLWRHWSIPNRGEPGAETWQGKDLLLGGGSTWLTGSYDLETDTLFWPTGNPYPDSNDRERPGDNLFTNCILALNPSTGALKWYFQFTPHDVLDRDATEPPVLIDTRYQGGERKLLLHADRNGFFYVLDRTNGKLLFNKQFVHRMNWSTGIGADGRPRLAAAYKASPNRQTGCPDDAANWGSTAFNPATRLYYFETLEQCGPVGVSGSLKTSARADEAGEKYLRAVNIDTGEIAWENAQPGHVLLKTWPGVLGTAGGLVFYSDPAGSFVAADATNGKALWHFATNITMKASPMTFLVDGRQYVAIAAGSNVLCFGLANEK